MNSGEHKQSEKGVRKLLFVSLFHGRCHVSPKPLPGVRKFIFVGRKSPQILKDGKNGINSLPFFLWFGDEKVHIR